MVEDGSQLSELDAHCHTSLCLGGCENPLPTGQMRGTNCLDGILHSSPKQSHLLDSMGFQSCEKACGHSFNYHSDKPSYPVTQAEGMVQESMDPDELDSEHRYSGHIGPSKPKKRIPKPIKKINPVLMTLGEDVLLNDIVLTNVVTLGEVWKA